MDQPVVATAAWRAGCWSACVKFRGLQRLSASMAVTTAEPRCLLGRCPVTPAPVRLERFLFSKQQQHVVRSSLMSATKSCGTWQILRRLRCHTVRAVTCSSAVKHCTADVLLLFFFFFLNLMFPSQQDSFSHRSSSFLPPQTFQLTARHRIHLTAVSNRKSQSIKTAERLLVL